MTLNRNQLKRIVNEIKADPQFVVVTDKLHLIRSYVMVYVFQQDEVRVGAPTISELFQMCEQVRDIIFASKKTN